MDSTQKELENESKLLSEMIKIYCKKKHNTKSCLCEECKELENYSNHRRGKCPFKNHNMVCSNCSVRCFSPVMREKIQKVMRFSGPRVLFYHPIITIGHMIKTFRSKGVR